MHDHEQKSMAELAMEQGINPFESIDDIHDLMMAAVGSGVGIGLNADGEHTRVDTDHALKAAEYLYDRLCELLGRQA